MRTPQVKMLVAGGTGYIGGGVLEAAKRAGIWVRALARDPSKLHVPVDDVFIGQATNRTTLKGMCNGIDIVFSSIGIHSYAANPTLWEVDYRANMNIVEEARRAGVKRMVFITVVQCEEMAKYSPIAEARLRVADAITRSGMEYSIYEPTGYFNDMEELLLFAQKYSFVPVFGDPDGKMNPLSALDFGETVVSDLGSERMRNRVSSIGGPTTMSHRDAATMAFRALGKPARIRGVPGGAFKFLARTIEPFHYNMSALFRFFEYCARHRELCGEPTGQRSLEQFYRHRASGMSLRDADRLSVIERPSVRPKAA